MSSYKCKILRLYTYKSDTAFFPCPVICISPLSRAESWVLYQSMKFSKEFKEILPLHFHWLHSPTLSSQGPHRSARVEVPRRVSTASSIQLPCGTGAQSPESFFVTWTAAETFQMLMYVCEHTWAHRHTELWCRKQKENWQKTQHCENFTHPLGGFHHQGGSIFGTKHTLRCSPGTEDEINRDNSKKSIQ